MHIKILTARRAYIAKATNKELAEVNDRLSGSYYDFFAQSTVRLTAVKGRYLPTNLLSRLKGMDYDLEGVEHIHTARDEQKMMDYVGTLGLPYDSLLPWQQRILYKMMCFTHGQGDVTMNSGKTYVNYVRSLIAITQGWKVLIVVPQVSLAKQMITEFNEFLPHLKHPKLKGLTIDSIFGGSKRVPDAPICIGNSASLGNIVNKNPSWFKQWDYVIFDESHTLVSEQSAINCYEYVYGFTKDSYGVSNYGKILREVWDAKGIFAYTGTIHKKPIARLVQEACFGAILETVKQKELIEFGASALPTYTQRVIELNQKSTALFRSKLKNFEDKVNNRQVMVFDGDFNAVKDAINTSVSLSAVHIKRISPNKYYLMGNSKTLAQIERFIPKIKTYNKKVETDILDQLEKAKVSEREKRMPEFEAIVAKNKRRKVSALVRTMEKELSKKAKDAIANKQLPKVEAKVMRYTDTIPFMFSKMYLYDLPEYQDTVIDYVMGMPTDHNQLIFADNLRTIHTLKARFEALGRTVRLFIGEMGVEDRETTKRFVEENDGVILIANYQVMAVGVSVKKLHGMHFYSSCKEFVRFMQAFGRIVRKHPDIPSVYAVDWTVKLNGEGCDLKPKQKYGYLYDHSKERLKHVKKDLELDYEIITIKKRT